MTASTKLQILRAAGRIVLQRGVTGLTLEAVASAAGLSKGGLLYHYGSKEALLRAMVGYLVDATDDQIDDHRQRDRARGSWTRGYLRTCVVDPAADEAPGARLAAAVLAAGASDPELLAGLRERQGDWRAASHADGIDPTTAQLVRLAADGLWMNDIFGLPVLTETERRAVLARLEALTQG